MLIRIIGVFVGYIAYSLYSYWSMIIHLEAAPGRAL